MTLVRGYVTSMATVVSAMPFKPSRSGSWFSLQLKKYLIVTDRTQGFPYASFNNLTGAICLYTAVTGIREKP